MSEARRTSVSEFLSEIVGKEAEGKRAERRAQETEERLRADLDGLLSAIMRQYNEEEAQRPPEELPRNHFCAERDDKGLRELKELRVYASKPEEETVVITVEAILVHSLIAMEEPVIFEKLRAALCPKIIASIEGFDDRLTCKPHLVIFHPGPTGELGNYEMLDWM